MLFKVYGNQLRKAGLFGQGSTIARDDDSELSETARQTSATFRSFDNNLIAWTLAYGYVGIALLVLLALLPLPGLVKVAFDRGNPFAVLAGSALGAIIGFQLALMTTALTRSFSMSWMFLAGLAVTIAQLGVPARVPGARAAWSSPLPPPSSPPPPLSPPKI
jgi:hypothetical protein